MPPPILILAAGQSSRMRGTDKMMEKIDGVALLRRQIDIALAVSSQVYVTLPRSNHPRSALVTDSNAVPVIVPQAADGLGISLRDGVAALPPCPSFMVILADLVALTAADILRMITTRDTHPNHLIWRGATVDGKAGHPILFDSSLRPAFGALSGDTGGAEILKTHKAQTYLVPLPSHHARLDLDTPEDWAAWRKTTRTPKTAP